VKRDIEDQYHIMMNGDKNAKGKWVIFKSYLSGKKEVLAELDNRQEAERLFLCKNEDFFDYLRTKYKTKSENHDKDNFQT